MYVEHEARTSLEHMRRALRAAWLEQFSAPPDATPLGRAMPVLPTSTQSSSLLRTTRDAAPLEISQRVPAFDSGPNCDSDEWTRLALAFRELGFAEAAQFCFTHALRPSAGATTWASSNLNSSYSIAQLTSSAQRAASRAASTSLAAAVSAATRSALSCVSSAPLQSSSAIAARDGTITEMTINKPSEGTLLPAAPRVFAFLFSYMVSSTRVT